MVKEDSLDKEIKEKIALMLADVDSWKNLSYLEKNHFIVKANKALAIIKESGWIDPSSCVMPGEFGTPKAKELLHEWATANGYIKKPKLPVLSDEDIRYKLEQIQPEGFDWANVTPTEMIKYRAIAQAYADLIKREWG